MKLFARKKGQDKVMHSDAIYMHAYALAATILEIELAHHTVEKVCKLENPHRDGPYSSGDIQAIKEVIRQIVQDLNGTSIEYTRGRVSLRYIEYPDEQQG